MPCFSSGPAPDTPEYEEWLQDVRPKLDRFIHVVDYYYRKAGLTMPEPSSPATGDWDATPDSPPGNARVLDHILLHLDCDDVDVFHLNDILNLLRTDRTPRGRGYNRVLGYCFQALRNGFRHRPTTAGMWQECSVVEWMLDHLRGQVSDRKLRLFAVACCRRVPHLIADTSSQAEIEAAERFADGDIGEAELAPFQNQMGVEETRGYEGPVSAWAVAPPAELAAEDTAWSAFCRRTEMKEGSYQTELLRCVTGNPFRPISFDHEWRTETVKAMASRMYETRDYSAMPILADALEEAGCDSAAVLEHCRDSKASHTRGCWVIDAILGRV